MALTDPVNVQQGEQRRKLLLQRLAQQMAARGGRGVNVTGRSTAGNGRSFNNATDLRGMGAARLALGFDLPNGRARPAGFDPGAQGDGIPGVIQSGPPGLGGGAGVGAASAAAGIDLTGLPQVDQSIPGGFPQAPTPGVSGNSDTPLTTPLASATPNYGLDPAIAAAMNAQANQPPDPYQVMMSRIAMLRQARMDAMGVGA